MTALRAEILELFEEAQGRSTWPCQFGELSIRGRKRAAVVAKPRVCSPVPPLPCPPAASSRALRAALNVGLAVVNSEALRAAAESFAREELMRGNHGK